jgi:hypothetical protein
MTKYEIRMANESKIENRKSKIFDFGFPTFVHRHFPCLLSLDPSEPFMTCGFIDDGYTLDGFVKELPGIYGAVRFKYRPLTVEQRVRLFESWSTLPALDQISRTTSALARQIVQWDMKDAKGRPIPCNEPRSFRRLSPPLHERLLDIVCGSSPPDADPDKGDDPNATDPTETTAS